MGRFIKKLRYRVGSLIIGALIVTQCTSCVSETKIGQNENFFGMTKQQWLEDYEYLWQTLNENYAFFGVAERDGVNVEEIYIRNKEKLQEGASDEVFYTCIYDLVHDIGQYGHLDLIETDYYNSLRQTFSNDPQRAQWDKVINADKTIEGYEKLDKMYRALGVYDRAARRMADMNVAQYANVSTCELIKDQVAYMKIDSFEEKQIKDDQKLIYDFYKQVADYDHLIIDLTTNGGGSDNYWMKLLAAPQVKKATTISHYALLKEGENNKRYYENAFGEYELREIKNLPNLPKLNKQDLQEMKYFVEETKTITPSEVSPIFKGKIWVLTSEKVYSSAENFVQFCKATGFAQLVGTTTGGDGGGIDPGYITLPNSGLLIRYSITYSLNQDGGNSEECGTEPDIRSGYLENPLVTCLKAINK